MCISVCATVLLVVAEQGDNTLVKAASSAIADGGRSPLSNKQRECIIISMELQLLRFQMNLYQQKRVILDDKGTIKTVKRCHFNLTHER